MHHNKSIVLALLLALCLSLTPVWADSSYTDVLEGQWYTDGVNFAIEHQVFKLDSTSEFGLNQQVTRSEMVYALWMLYHQPQAATVQDFSDLSADAYYHDAVQWAASVGITSGMGNGQFGVDQYLTREQTVTFLENAAIYLGGNVEEETNILSYDDFDQISQYAIGPFQWACGEGIITGTSESTLSPKGQLTRAQLSVILLKFYSGRDSGENTFGQNATPALIQLEGNATTGYGWYVSEANDDLYLVTEKDYLSSSTDLAIAGAGGTFQFEVTGQKPGSDTLTFLYYRSWEGAEQAIYKAVYQIEVSDNGSVQATEISNASLDSRENTFDPNATPALIQLEGNATTGYGWYVSEANDDLYLVTEKDYLSSSTDVATDGAGGIFQFEVTGQKPGSDTLTFLYYRSWEGAEQAIYKAVYQIEVADNGSVQATEISNTSLDSGENTFSQNQRSQFVPIPY